MARDKIFDRDTWQAMVDGLSRVRKGDTALPTVGPTMGPTVGPATRPSHQLAQTGDKGSLSEWDPFLIER